MLFTLLIVAGLLWATNAGAIPLRVPTAATTTGTIAYQGRLADSAGTPITDTVNMEFRLYDVAEAGTPLWSELWTGSNAVRVSDGLFNVMLGSLEPIPQGVVAGHDQLYLSVTVGTDDEMSPRVQLGSVPFAVQVLTVPDGSVTTVKIGDSQVTDAKLASPIITQWIELCFTSYSTCPGVVSNFSSESMGGSRIWSGSFNFTPFDRGIVSAVGRIYLADDTTHLADVPVAIWQENSNTARFSAILPDRYFNTVNSRLKVTLVGR